MTKITHPHDKMFRGIMHDITVAQSFLSRYMSEADIAQLNLATLTLKNSNAIDKHLTEFISDLVYSCQYQDPSLGESRIIILVEHQSTPDKLMPFRVYHYLFNILANELKENSNIDKLPAVCALVFYNGKQTPYPYSMKLQDCFDDPKGLMKQFWQKPINLVDATQYEDDILVTQELGGLLVLALKHGQHKQDVSDAILLIAQTLMTIDMDPELRLQFIDRAINYLFAVGQISDKKQFQQKIEAVHNSMRGKIMTFLEEMKMEGRVEGIAEGKAEGKAEGRVEGIAEGKTEIAMNLIKLKLNHDLIAEYTGLSLESIAELQNSIDFE